MLGYAHVSRFNIFLARKRPIFFRFYTLLESKKQGFKEVSGTHSSQHDTSIRYMFDDKGLTRINTVRGNRIWWHKVGRDVGKTKHEGPS